MKKGLLTILLLAGMMANPLYSQPVEPYVNIFRKDTTPKPDKNKVKFILQLDARRSFVLNQSVRFYGLRLGLEYNYKHRFGIGIYGINDPVLLTNAPVLVPSRDSIDPFIDTVDLMFDFDYWSFFYERVIYRNRRWEASVPIHLGLGRINGSYRDRRERLWVPIDYPVALSEISAVGQYNVFRWLGLGTGMGYRWLWVGDQRVRSAYNAPVYMIKVKVMVGELYKSVFRRDNDNNEDA